MEVKYGITRTMTLRNRVGSQIVSEFGGVVFCRPIAVTCTSLRDVRGQRLAAVEQTSFGGWHMALREFGRQASIPNGTVPGCYFWTRTPRWSGRFSPGEADIGTVRTDTIERMAADGEIRMDEIRVFPGRSCIGTRRRPSPMCTAPAFIPNGRLQNSPTQPTDLSREVTVALLSMPADSPAAMAAESGGMGSLSRLRQRS